MFLNDIRSVIPEFQMSQFNLFDTIVDFQWKVEMDYVLWEEHKDVYISMVGNEKYKIEMQFVNVSNLKLQGNGQIMGFYIKDMSINGYENCFKYEVGDYEDGDIQFYCEDILIKKIMEI